MAMPAVIIAHYYSAICWEKQDRNVDSYSHSYFSVYVFYFSNHQNLLSIYEPCSCSKATNEAFPLVNCKTSQYFVC